MSQKTVIYRCINYKNRHWHWYLSMCFFIPFIPANHIINSIANKTLRVFTYKNRVSNRKKG